MTTLHLPGLVDVHVHTRDPGQTHKEDWASATAAALAGGFTTVLAMPNTHPPVTDRPSLDQALAAATAGARCDYAQYAGATSTNSRSVAALAPLTVGIKLYLNDTFGDLRMTDLDDWWSHLEAWPADRPLVAHAEGPALATMILMASYLERPVHLCHVSRRDEITLIHRAKHRGQPVTCEVTPHHLFLDAETTAGWAGRSDVRPRLSDPRDTEALWEHLEAIDCIATDHAPHTIAEKDGPNPPPGFPGLETALPLLLGAVHEDRLSIDDVVDRLSTNPKRIFDIPEQPDTTVEVDSDARVTLSGAASHTRARWTPFEGMVTRGRVTTVTLRGQTVFRDGQVIATPGTGRNIREEEQP